MHSYNVDDRLKDRAIIEEALIKTCKSKRKKKTGSNSKYKKAQYILSHLDKYVEKTLETVLAFEAMTRAGERGEKINPEILKKAYKPKKCVPFIIKDGASKKVREITSVPLFPDQVIHQLIIIAAQPVFMRGMYEYSCGSIPGRGIHKGKKYIEKIINHHRRHDKSAIKYGVQLDITKCYPSISHSHLKGQLRKKFRGKLFTWLTFAIIDSYCFTVVDGEPVGLPIGYSTSQWLCNFELTSIDSVVKEKLKIKHYVRYMDDMIFFGRNKKKLHQAVDLIVSYAASIGLKIKRNMQVFRFDHINKQGERRGRALDFLGFRFFRDKIILRKRLALAIRRAVKTISKMRKVTAHAALSLMSRLGWLRHCNSYNFYQKYVKPYINIRKLKGVIRRESREHSNASCAV